MIFKKFYTYLFVIVGCVSCAPKQVPVVPVSQINEVPKEQVSPVSQNDDVAKQVSEAPVSQNDGVAKESALVFVDNNPECPVLGFPSLETNPIPKDQQHPLIVTLQPDETNKARIWFKDDVRNLYVGEVPASCPLKTQYPVDFEVDCDGDGEYEQKYWRPDLTQDSGNMVRKRG